MCERGLIAEKENIGGRRSWTRFLKKRGSRAAINPNFDCRGLRFSHFLGKSHTNAANRAEGESSKIGRPCYLVGAGLLTSKPTIAEGMIRRKYQDAEMVGRQTG